MRPGVLRLTLALAVLACGSGERSPAPLVVSITFDDGYAHDDQAAQLLSEHQMKGTFFIIGGYLNHNGYLTVDQLRAIGAMGHEIGGHTVSHPHLTTLSLDEARLQICQDRSTLISYGFRPQSFAYPYGEWSDPLKIVASACGYEVARSVGPITQPSAPVAETVPPTDPYAVITPWAVLDTTTLEELEGWVTSAQATGGWLPIVFHHLCQPGETCAQYGVTVADFTAFLDWLARRDGVVTKTVSEVSGGHFQAPVALPNPLFDPGLEGSLDGGVPPGWQRGGSGVNDATWTTTSLGAHGGQSAQRVDITSYTSGSAVLVPALHVFAPPAQGGHTYQVSAWYQSTAQPRWVIYVRDAGGNWAWWTQSPRLTAQPGWASSSWVTPPLPSQSTGIGFGLALSSVGSLTVDDFSLTDTGAVP